MIPILRSAISRQNEHHDEEGVAVKPIQPSSDEEGCDTGTDRSVPDLKSLLMAYAHPGGHECDEGHQKKEEREHASAVEDLHDQIMAMGVADRLSSGRRIIHAHPEQRMRFEYLQGHLPYLRTPRERS